MNLIPRNSFLNDVFDFGSDTFLKETDFMKSDIYKKEGNYVVEMDLPGIRKEDIKMELDNGYLTITAKKESCHDEKGDYIRKERFYGEMKRSFYIGDVEEDNIRASFENGTLKVTFKEEKVSNNKKQISID